MKSNKKATTIDKQIELLQSRGMDLDYDLEKVKDILKDIGYYRLGFYWRSFDLKYDKDANESEHKFKEGTKFSTVVDLYYLNHELRLLLLRYLHRVEINFRTKMIYRISRKYPDDPFWFCNDDVVKETYLTKLSKIYKNIKIWNAPIREHHRKYLDDSYAPAWKTIEFFDFGQTLNLFQALKFDADRKMLISEYPEFTRTKAFATAIRCLIELRNACSHGSVLFDYYSPHTIPFIQGVNFNQGVPKNFDSHLRLLLYFVGKISVNRRKELLENLNMLLAKFTSNNEIENIVKNEMGYVHFR